MLRICRGHHNKLAAMRLAVSNEHGPMLYGFHRFHIIRPIVCPYNTRIACSIPCCCCTSTTMHSDIVICQHHINFHMSTVSFPLLPSSSTHRVSPFPLRAVAPTTRRRPAGRNSPRRKSARTRTKPFAFERFPWEGTPQGDPPRAHGRDLSFYPVIAG